MQHVLHVSDATSHQETVAPLEWTSSKAARIDHPATPPKRYYRPELDLLRFFAFAMVFTHHQLDISFQPNGFHLVFAFEEAGAAGVCLFFTLSAFLITELLLREKETTGTIHVKAFYARRILRIWPLYLAFVFFAMMLPFVVHRYSAPAGYIVPFLLLCGNWAIVILGAFPHNPALGTLWTISVEEQFYLLWPTIMHRWGRRAITWFAVGLLPVAWLTDYLVIALHGRKEPTLWCNSFSQFQFFALGALLAVAFHHRTPKNHPAVRFLCFAGAVGFLMLSAFPFHYLNPVPPTWNTQALSGYLCLDAACVLILIGFLGAKLHAFWKPFIYLGKISYGLYVYHFVIRVAVAAFVSRKLHAPTQLQVPITYAVSAVITIAAAILSYEYFEKPFLRLKKRFTFIRSRPD